MKENHTGHLSSSSFRRSSFLPTTGCRNGSRPTSTCASIPLLGLTGFLASREVIGRVLWSLLLVGATLVIGRFFCAYVCPLGASLDFLDPLSFRKEAPAT